MKKRVLVKLVGDVSFYISCAVIVLIVLLYLLDIVDISNMKNFVANEYNVLYSDVSEFEDISTYNTMSYLLEHYKSIKAGLMFQDRECSVMTLEQADNLYNALLPDNINTYNAYIRPYVYTQVINDVMSSVSDESEDYYEIQYTYLNKLRLHEVYLYKNVYGWLYKYMKALSGTLVIMYILNIIIYISTHLYLLISTRRSYVGQS